MFTACFGKERQYGFLVKELAANLFAIFSNNRLNFHEEDRGAIGKTCQGECGLPSRKLI